MINRLNDIFVVTISFLFSCFNFLFGFLVLISIPSYKYARHNMPFKRYNMSFKRDIFCFDFHSHFIVSVFLFVFFFFDKYRKGNVPSGIP